MIFKFNRRKYHCNCCIYTYKIYQFRYTYLFRDVEGKGEKETNAVSSYYDTMRDKSDPNLGIVN